MGNHSIECDYCGEDTRGLAGVRGCHNGAEAQKCYVYQRRHANDNTRPVAPTTRRGDWMQTFTGKQAWPLDMRPEDIFIVDIAHSLAMQCRFAGHCLRYYSVAEHSVLVADWLLDQYGKEAALWGLLHDASEAYLVDVPRPVKPFLPGYRDAERAVMRAVCERFGLPAEMPSCVHEADNRILWDEKEQNMAPCAAEWSGAPDPLGVRLEFWSPAFAKAVFLMRFSSLTVDERLDERRAA